MLPLVVRIEKAAPPARTDALETAARAVLTMLSDERSLGDGERRVGAGDPGLAGRPDPQGRPAGARRRVAAGRGAAGHHGDREVGRGAGLPAGPAGRLAQGTRHAPGLRHRPRRPRAAGGRRPGGARAVAQPGPRHVGRQVDGPGGPRRPTRLVGTVGRGAHGLARRRLPAHRPHRRPGPLASNSPPPGSRWSATRASRRSRPGRRSPSREYDRVGALRPDHVRWSAD